MLDPDERYRIAEQFGVDGAQVLRDHLISHVLAALSSEAPDAVLFFGGTALARSTLIEGRLSEDVDLIAVGSRGTVAEHLTAAIPRALRREFPGLIWSPSLSEGRSSDAAILRNTDGIAVRIQLLSAVGYPRWPTERVALTQRYSDAPPAVLTVFTAAGFVAAKTARVARPSRTGRSVGPLGPRRAGSRDRRSRRPLRTTWPHQPTTRPRGLHPTPGRGPMAPRPCSPGAPDSDSR